MSSDAADLRDRRPRRLPHLRRRLAPGPAEPARRSAARSAPAGSRRPSRTTCAGSSTAGRRCPTTAARSCSTRRSTTPRSGRSAPRAPRRVVDLWAERTAALGARDDVAYVLVFENRGAAVGATITHPHGQIYAFDFVPELPLRELERGERLDEPGRPARRRGAGLAGVGAARRRCSRTRCGSRPTSRCPTCRRSTTPAATALAALLVDVLERLDRALRRRDAVHAVDPPAAVRRRRLAAGAAARRDRDAVAGARRAALRRRRRARLRRLLRPGAARGGGAGAARRRA